MTLAGTGRLVDLEKDVSTESLYAAMCEAPSNHSASRRQMKWAVRSFAGYLSREGLLDASVGKEISQMTVARSSTPPTPALTSTEINQVLSWLEDGGDYDPVERVTLAALFATYALTGVRNSELCKVYLQDVELETGWLVVREGKGRQPRNLVMPDRLVPLLRLYRDHYRPNSKTPNFFVGKTGKPLNRELVGKRFRRLAAQADLNLPAHHLKLPAHHLRYAFATNAVRRHKAPLIFLQQILGHSRLSTTESYVHLHAGEGMKDMRGW